MPLRLDPPALPEWEQPFATVQEQSRQLGLWAFVVGGYVRDRLLGGERGKTIREVDILVDGRGATQLATAVGSALKLRPPVIFERFVSRPPCNSASTPAWNRRSGRRRGGCSRR